MAKKIAINLGSLKSFFGKLVKNLTWLFFAIFLVLLVFEALEVQNSYSIISNVNQSPPIVGAEKGFRINFDNYQRAVDRIEQAASFQPSGGITTNPFATQFVPTPGP